MSSDPVTCPVQPCQGHGFGRAVNVILEFFRSVEKLWLLLEFRIHV